MADVHNRFLIEFALRKTGLTQAQRELNKLNRNHQKVSRDIPRATRIMSTRVNHELNKQGRTVKTLVVTWRDASNRIHTSTLKMSQSGKLLSGSVRATTGAFGRLNKGMAGIVSRALKTIPVWYALRTAMTTVINTVQDFINYTRELEKALARVQAVIHGTVETQKVLVEIQEEANRLTRESGQSITDVLEAYYRFGTVGLDVTTALKGMNTSTKLAVALMGDQEKVADVLAQTYLLMGDRIEANIEQQDKLQHISAVIASLFTKNRFELNEFASAMERANPIFNQLNISFEEQVAILATLHQAGIRNTRTGRLLLRTFIQIAQKSGDIAKEIGLVVDEYEKLDFIELLKEVVRVNKELGITPKTLETIAKQFGSRATQIILGLTSFFEKWNENLDTARKDTKELTDELGRLYNVQLNQFERVQNRFRNVRRQFIREVLGGEEILRGWKGILNDLTDLMEDALGRQTTSEMAKRLQTNLIDALEREQRKQVPAYQRLGRRILEAISATDVTGAQLIEPVGDVIKRSIDRMVKEGIRPSKDEIQAWADAYMISVESVNKLLDKLIESWGGLDSIVQDSSKIAQKELQALADSIGEVSLDKVLKGFEGTIQEMGQRMANATKMIREVEDVTRASNIQFELALMKLQGFTDSSIAMAELVSLIENMAIEAQRLGREIDTDQLLVDIFNENWLKVRETLSGVIDTKKDLKKIADQYYNVLKNIRKETAKFSNELKSGFKSALAELLKEGDLSNFFDQLRTKLIDMWADAMANSMTEAVGAGTGIFDFTGGILQGIENTGQQILQSSYQGSQYYRRAIIESSQVGANIIRGATAGVPGGVPAVGATGVVGGVPTIPPPAGVPRQPQVTGTGAGVFARLNRPIGAWWGGGQMTWGQGMGAFAMGALAGANRGAGGAIMGGLGSLFMMAGHPIIGGLFALGSLFFGKSRTTVQRESTWTPERVRDMLPFYQATIAPLPRLFPLPRSRYFGRRSPVEININIANVSGTNEEIANDIAKQVELSIGKALPIDYMRNIERGDMIQRIIF